MRQPSRAATFLGRPTVAQMFNEKLGEVLNFAQGRGSGRWPQNCHQLLLAAPTS